MIPTANVTARIPQLGLEPALRALAPANYTLGNVLVPQTLEFIDRLAALLSTTPRDTVESYFLWTVILSGRGLVMHGDGSDDVFAPLDDLIGRLSGTPPDRAAVAADRWMMCMTHVSDGLGWILSRFFIEGAFSARERDLGLRIIDDIEAYYAAKFGGLAWMDDATRQGALDKLGMIVPKIGYPNQVNC